MKNKEPNDKCEWIHVGFDPLSHANIRTFFEEICPKKKARGIAASRAKHGLDVDILYLPISKPMLYLQLMLRSWRM
jgi:hypothetical protein